MSPVYQHDRKHKEKIEALIAQGHSEDHEDAREEVIEVEVEDNRQLTNNNDVSNGNGSEEEEEAECPETHPGPFHPSQTISDELSSLQAQETKARKDKDELEEILREEDVPTNMEEQMQRR